MSKHKPLNKIREEKLKADLKDIRVNYRITFTEPSGKRVLEDLKSKLLHGKTLFHPDISNEELCYLSGRQSVINEILQTLEELKK